MTETDSGNDIFRIKRNFTAIALFVLIVLVLIDVLLRFAPGSVKPVDRAGQISAVGHHHEFPDGSSYYIYTIFEADGDVYQCWWDEESWNQKKVTNYKSPTVEPVDK